MSRGTGIGDLIQMGIIVSITLLTLPLASSILNDITDITNTSASTTSILPNNGVPEEAVPSLKDELSASQRSLCIDNIEYYEMRIRTASDIYGEGELLERELERLEEELRKEKERCYESDED